MPDNQSSVLNLNLPLRTIVPWVGAILLAAVGGTFAITRYSTSAHIAALSTQRDAEHERANRAEAAARQAALPSSSAPLPEVTLSSAGKSPELSSLARRIQDLERERAELVSELVSQSRNALAPESELAGLIRDLGSGDVETRRQAVHGLFTLGDPRSFHALAGFFTEHPKEATEGLEPSVGEWFGLLLELDRDAGTQFLIQQLEAEDPFHAEVAYERLLSPFYDAAPSQAVVKQLQYLALRSPSPVVRTRAKVLLVDFEQRLKEKPRARDGRSIIQILIDIEKTVKGMAAKKNAP